MSIRNIVRWIIAYNNALSMGFFLEHTACRTAKSDVDLTPDRPVDSGSNNTFLESIQLRSNYCAGTIALISTTVFIQVLVFSLGMFSWRNSIVIVVIFDSRRLHLCAILITILSAPSARSSFLYQRLYSVAQSHELIVKTSVWSVRMMLQTRRMRPYKAGSANVLHCE